MTEPAAVLQALIDRLNPVTPAETARDLIETLAGLVAQAARSGPYYTAVLATALRAAQVPIYEAMLGMPRAAPRSVPQGGQGLPRSSGSGETLDAASDAHSPGTGGAPDDPLRRFIAEVDRYVEERQRHSPGTDHRWACPRCGHDLEAAIALLGPEWKG